MLQKVRLYLLIDTIGINVEKRLEGYPANSSNISGGGSESGGRESGTFHFYLVHF